MEDIFEGLDEIDWSELCHAYGSAEDVPDLLRELISETAEDRQNAMHQLLGNVWHQGTIYEASSHVVTFLVRMLGSPSTPDRSQVALLLASIAGGSSYLEVHAPPNTERRTTWHETLTKQGKDFDGQLELERSWVRATREAVEPHLQLLYEFIHHEEPDLRVGVAEALSCFPSHATRSILVLTNSIDLETEDYVKEAMEESRSRLENSFEEN